VSTDLPTGPSIVVVLIDALRADYLGCYGFQGNISPHLDRFAADSVIFERCYSQAPGTLPSVASLFTSMHPQVHGVVSRAPTIRARWQALGGFWTSDIPESATTLAEALAEAGYQTGAFVANPWLVPWLGFGRGFDTYDDRWADIRTEADRVVAAASRWLHRRTPSRPSFLYLHLMDVHGPYAAPETDVEPVRHSPSLGPERTLTDAERRRIDSYLREPDWTAGSDGESLRGWRARYAAGVHAVDRQLAQFFAGLRSSGVFDRAIVVVTSDHGEELGEHGGWNHGKNLYDHQLHVPLLLHYPDGGPRGVRVNRVVNLTDVMRTLLSAAGVPLPDTVGGRDLTPLLDAPLAVETDPLSLATGIKGRPSAHSLYDGRYKLIVNLDRGRTELYDLDNDPGEQSDLSSDRADVARELLIRLRGELEQLISDASAYGQEVRLPSAVEERLRALGYAD
jgi:arylsulfatase A-like enzyme